MCDFIKNIDLFGYKIRLNFNKQGSTFKTSCGAFLSLILYIVVLYTFLMTLQSFLLDLNPTYSRSEHPMNWNRSDAINLLG